MVAPCNFVLNGIDPSALVEQLRANGDLWGEIQYRMEPHGDIQSPHRESMDIHLRYNHIDNADKPDFHCTPYLPVWYPAISKLSAVIPMISSLIAKLPCDILGSVFLINVPKGKQIYPHVDLSWNSTYFHKFCVGLQNHDARGICGFENSAFAPMPGDVWQFENNVTHWFDNTNGLDDCLMMIVNMRPVLMGVCEDQYAA